MRPGADNEELLRHAEELLRQAKEGIPDWGAILRACYIPMSHAAIRGLLGMGLNPSEDEDLVADAVLLGFKRLQRKGLAECEVSLVGYASSFGFYAGKQVARDYYKRNQERFEIPEGLFDDEDIIPGEIIAGLEEEQRRQELLAQRWKAAQECLDLLTPGQREAVVEVEINLKSDTQLANETGVSHSAIWTRRTKGLQNLRRCVEQKLGGVT